jgi:hypothetical protein
MMVWMRCLRKQVLDQMLHVILVAMLALYTVIYLHVHMYISRYTTLSQDAIFHSFPNLRFLDT